MRKRKKEKKKLVALIAVFVGIIAVLAAVYFVMKNFENRTVVDNADKVLTTYDEVKTMYINNDKYMLKSNLYSVLVGGVDVSGKVERSTAYINSEQMDFLALVVFDLSNSTCKILHINRDTMTDVPVLGVTGDRAGFAFEQIALSHAYGSGLEDSCENTVDAVEKLLGQPKVNNYIVLNMDAIPILNDEFGGVEVEIKDDFSQVDSSLIMGETMRLMGKQALTFTRVRWNVSDETNLARMERQKQYIESFFNQFKLYLEEDNTAGVTAFNSVTDYMVTDCDVKNLSELQAKLIKCSNPVLYDVPGEAKKGTEFMEYYVNEGEMKNVLADIFYDKVS